MGVVFVQFGWMWYFLCVELPVGDLKGLWRCVMDMYGAGGWGSVKG